MMDTDRSAWTWIDTVVNVNGCFVQLLLLAVVFIHNSHRESKFASRAKNQNFESNAAPRGLLYSTEYRL
jgi:hypothetical protein